MYNVLSDAINNSGYIASNEQLVKWNWSGKKSVMA